MFTISISVGLIIVGVIFHNLDSLIIGGIFGAGGVILFIIVFVEHCRAYLKNKQVHAIPFQDSKNVQKKWMSLHVLDIAFERNKERETSKDIKKGFIVEHVLWLKDISTGDSFPIIS